MNSIKLQSSKILVIFDVLPDNNDFFSKDRLFRRQKNMISLADKINLPHIKDKTLIEVK